MKELYLSKVGDIEARLTESKEEIIACQKLRYKIFFEELGANSGAEQNPKVHEEKRDFDQFDEKCNHIIMYDTSVEGSIEDKIIGTYRLIEKEHISEIGHFFSQYEFDVSSLMNYSKGKVLELGRACIKSEYRNNIVMKLLWNVIADYFFKNDIKLMFGEADWPTTDVKEIKEALSMIRTYSKNKPVSKELSVIKSKQKTWDELDLIPEEKLDQRKALKSILPLIKGYMRVGCNFADGVFIDPLFNSTSVLILLDMDQLDKKYFEHYAKKQ